jgi:sulfur carrier protein
MITVRGERWPWREGLTVQEVLKRAGFEGRLVYVRVDGHRVGPPKWGTQLVCDGSEVEILPVVLGG